MTALSLYKWIFETKTEIAWRQEMLIAWISPHDLKEFADIVENALGEGGLECILLSGGSIGIDLVQICDYFGINPEHLSKKEVG